jgi:hypothetical protein
MKPEISLYKVPRQNIGFYYTWKHYHRHIISLWFYLGRGWKLDITVMEN